jgi:hypothetical protein
VPSYRREPRSARMPATITRVGGEAGLGEDQPPSGRRQALQPVALRAPLTLQVTWLGGRAEPVVMVRCDGSSWFIRGATPVWELVLRVKGWQPVA